MINLEQKESIVPVLVSFERDHMNGEASSDDDGVRSKKRVKYVFALFRIWRDIHNNHDNSYNIHNDDAIQKQEDHEEVEDKVGR